MKRAVVKVGAALVAVVLVLVAAVVLLNLRGESPLPDEPERFVGTPQQVERGAYLVRAGNCIGCHTTRGGAEFAGGLGIETPFGTVYSTNLTPDAATGIGQWSSAQFWRALHNGRSRDGRLLYPAFPYPSYTHVTREDADAIYAYLRSLPPVEQARRPHALRFPYNTQAALAVWRALFFTPGVYEPEAARSADWNRGAYLVRGLGHCAACHASRNLLGASRDPLEPGGELLPQANWYAPSLLSPNEAGVGDWPIQDIVALLQTGVSPRGSALGPMAEVVFRSTQHLSEADLRSMAVYLKDLSRPASPASVAAPGVLERGGKLYEQHCAQCHGDEGQGAPGAYPPLAGNRAVTMDAATNAIRAVLDGGYAPSTAGNPRPYGMPPYRPLLDDAEIAAVLSYIRGSWGNAAAPVSNLQVLQAR